MRAEIVLAVNELGMGASYRDWFFRTEVDTILGQYFEEWTANKSQTEWYLCQACLHLFRKPSLHEAPAPMLSIHCEPRHNGSEIGDRCKRGPHVHVDCAGYPVKKAHFPLNFGHIDRVLESMTTLTAALSDAVQIAHNEVVMADWTRG